MTEDSGAFDDGDSSDGGDATAPDPRRSGDVSRAYDHWSSTYDDDRNITRDLDAVVLRASGLDIAGRDVLELGCGTGKNTKWLAESARRVFAVDFSRGMLDVARRVPRPNVAFAELDIRERWPLARAAFDVVVENLVLEHVEDVGAVFRQAFAALRPRGVLYVAELHPYRQLQGGQAHFRDGETGDAVYVPAFIHSMSEYVNAAVAAGFAVERLGEWRERGADGLPRLVTLTARVA